MKPMHERCAGYDEWYVFEKPVPPGEIEVFVNWLGFRVYDPEFKWCADRLWEQMTRLAPESYIADGSVFTFATRNADLFAEVRSTLPLRVLVELGENKSRSRR